MTKENMDVELKALTATRLYRQAMDEMKGDAGMVIAYVCTMMANLREAGMLDRLLAVFNEDLSPDERLIAWGDAYDSSIRVAEKIVKESRERIESLENENDILRTALDEMSAQMKTTGKEG